MMRFSAVMPVLVGGLIAAAAAQQGPQDALPQGQPRLGEPKVDANPVILRLGERTATADARSTGVAHNSAPLIEVLQPQPNALVVTMTGVSVVAGVPCEESVNEVMFDLLQSVQVVTGRPDQKVKLVMEAQLAGLFRGSRDGAGIASISPALATIYAGDTPAMQIEFPGRTQRGKDLVLITDRSTPRELVVGPGHFTLEQRFALHCSHPKKMFHKNVMTVAFGPDSGRIPEWMSLLDPTRDIPRQREFGFRVILRADPVH
ncbi:MAG TPA: hypothetical protein VLM40_14645 [Gemmata sp.]|nr:hypothetical protein [Gemmata sp.]